METAPAMEGLSEEFIRKNEKYLKIIRGFRLLDDDFMSKVFEDKACANLLLQIILERDDLTVQEVHGQHDIKNRDPAPGRRCRCPPGQVQQQFAGCQPDQPQ